MSTISYLNSLERFGIKLGLDRVERVLSRLGDPHQRLRYIHVAGTNGKGSTCAMIASILQRAGYRVGLYTSPHLFRYNERIKINGKDISDQMMGEGVRRVKRVIEGDPPSLKLRRAGIEKEKTPLKLTAFEVLTVVAFWCFAKEKVDVVILETGMGGRLDATNVITPLVSVITNIDLEHTAYLGKTLKKIAREKGGIIKPGVSVVTAETKKEPLAELKSICRQKKSLLVQIGRPKVRLPVALAGEHQQLNAACAIAAIRLAGLPLRKKEIVAGLKKVSWPARFQVVKKKPLTIIDGAHNPAGIKTLVSVLRQNFPGKKFVFVFGVQQDKDLASMIRLLRPLARKIFFTASAHPQARKELPDLLALDSVLCATASVDRVIVGSLFLAAEVKKSCFLDEKLA